jgi:hypothetical protein
VSKAGSVECVSPLGAWRVGPQAATLIEARQAESAGDRLGELLNDITEAADAVRAFVRCADSGAPSRIGAAGSAMGAAVAVGGVGEIGYHESVAVPP